jgi:hypothetical protein
LLGGKDPTGRLIVLLRPTILKRRSDEPPGLSRRSSSGGEALVSSPLRGCGAPLVGGGMR